MQLLTAKVPSSFNLVLMGDDHEGSRLKSQNSVEQALDYIAATHDTYFIHMSDAIEAITVNDKRYVLESTSQSIPLRQALRVAEQYQRVGSQCLAWLMGNHEWKLWQVGNLTKDVICRNMGIEDKYAGYSCNIDFFDKHGRMFGGHFRHGIGSNLISNAKDEEQRQANMKATLKMRLKRKFGNTILMAAG